jgi:hypothetical protein
MSPKWPTRLIALPPSVTSSVMSRVVFSAGSSCFSASLLPFGWPWPMSAKTIMWTSVSGPKRGRQERERCAVASAVAAEAVVDALAGWQVRQRGVVERGRVKPAFLHAHEPRRRPASSEPGTVLESLQMMTP